MTSSFRVGILIKVYIGLHFYGADVSTDYLTVDYKPPSIVYSISYRTNSIKRKKVALHPQPFPFSGVRQNNTMTALPVIMCRFFAPFGQKYKAKFFSEISLIFLSGNVVSGLTFRRANGTIITVEYSTGSGKRRLSATDSRQWRDGFCACLCAVLSASLSGGKK